MKVLPRHCERSEAIPLHRPRRQGLPQPPDCRVPIASGLAKTRGGGTTVSGSGPSPPRHCERSEAIPVCGVLLSSLQSVILNEARRSEESRDSSPPTRRGTQNDKEGRHCERSEAIRLHGKWVT